jgi:hypothetical protein
MSSSYPASAALFVEVLLKNRKALDPISAQPVGPLDGTDFVVPLILTAVGMLAVLLFLQFMGDFIGGLAGLKRSMKTKFAHTFSELCYYVMSNICLFCLCWNASWYWPSGWHEVMFDGRVQKVPELKPYTAPADLKLFYMIETSYYVSSFVLLLMRPKKKDFIEMAFHHIVTASLLLLSYTTGYLRIGTVVMYLHNIFDPFMLFAKCAHYAKIPILPDVSFALCTVAFAVSRLYYYPIAIYHAWSGVCVANATCPGGLWDKTPIEFALIGLLMALLPIHMFWFTMILKVLFKALASSGVQGDVRSDSDEETTPAKIDPVEPNKKKTK